MVFIVAGGENVVADDLAVSFENGSEFPRPADSNLFENIDPFGVPFGASHRPPSMGEDIIVGQRFGQTEEKWTPKRTPKWDLCLPQRQKLIPPCTQLPILTTRQALPDPMHGFDASAVRAATASQRIS
jgi:hypothetical protein